MRPGGRSSVELTTGREDLGTELVVATGGPSPGCTFAPLERPTLLDPLRNGAGRVGTLSSWSRDDPMVPKIGISPEVGVSCSRNSSCVAGESWGAR